MVLIGNASIDENNNISGGLAGNQTGTELCIRDWYNIGWTAVLRAKDLHIADKLANLMEQACNNKHIGYDQDNRLSLYQEAEKVNFELSAIKNDCECDCSSLVAVCVNGCGIRVNPNLYTGNEVQALLATNQFDIFTGDEYTQATRYLKRGDILVKRYYHTAIVLSNGSAVYENGGATQTKAVADAQGFDKSIAGIYRATTDAYIRANAGKAFHVIGVLKEGYVCRNYGYYTEVNGVKWFYIERGDIVGFISSRLLKKV